MTHYNAEQEWINSQFELIEPLNKEAEDLIDKNYVHMYQFLKKCYAEHVHRRDNHELISQKIVPISEAANELRNSLAKKIIAFYEKAGIPAELIKSFLFSCEPSVAELYQMHACAFEIDQATSMEQKLAIAKKYNHN